MPCPTIKSMTVLVVENKRCDCLLSNSRCKITTLIFTNSRSLLVAKIVSTALSLSFTKPKASLLQQHLILHLVKCKIIAPFNIFWLFLVFSEVFFISSGRGGRGGKFVRPGGMGGASEMGMKRPDLCDRNCVAPGICPSTSSIIATFSRTSRLCRQCVRNACGEM